MWHEVTRQQKSFTYRGYAGRVHQNRKIRQMITLARDTTVVMWRKLTTVSGPAATFFITKIQTEHFQG